MLFLLLAHGGSAFAESPAVETAAVASRVESYLDAFNRRDVDACAEHWSKNAEYLLPDSGQRMQGRQAIRNALQKLLNTDERFKLSLSDQRFRHVSKEVVIEEGTATLVSASHGVEQAQYLVLHVKQEGTWYRDSTRETAIAAKPASDGKLEQLAWLVGHWERQNDRGSVRMHGKWIHGKRFISRSFVVRGKDGYELNGTQIIGWDPSSEVVRSWSFDSEGGFEQAVWSYDGERWLVKVNAVLPDGSTGSEQRVLTPEQDGKFTSEVIDQQVDGRLLPGSDKETFVRVSEE